VFVEFHGFLLLNVVFCLGDAEACELMIQKPRTAGARFWFHDAFKCIAAVATVGAVGAATPVFHQIYDARAIERTVALRSYKTQNRKQVFSFPVVASHIT
jgi:hypothetical protein